jgi:hypothetical protein
VSFAAITLCVASQRVFIVVVYFVIDSIRKLLDTSTYALPKIITVIKSGGGGIRLVWHVVRIEEMRNVYKILVGKPEGKRALGRPRRSWEDSMERCELDASSSG